jgi:hypothetical protein
MRSARVASGLDSDGDALVAFRSPLSMRDGFPSEFSFADWDSSDPLPAYDDDVSGFTLANPPGSLVEDPISIPELPAHIPHHSSFGAASGVAIPIPASISQRRSVPPSPVSVPTDLAISVREGRATSPIMRRSNRTAKLPSVPAPSGAPSNIWKPVHQR